MRPSPLVACGPVALVAAATAVACAASENEGGPSDSLVDAGSELASRESDSSQADVDDKKDVEKPTTCSPAGWCVTALPDANLEMKHMWLLPGRAFALAESSTLGAKVLEWDDAEGKWSYIDDGTQNDTQDNSAVSTIRVGKVWAPGDDEVYYTVSPGYIYHGTRSAAPPRAWSWTRQRLGNAANEVSSALVASGALGVWGTSGNDIYAWSGDTIYHWTSVGGGASDWVAEYVAPEVDAGGQALAFLGAAGSSPDDVWFSGGRTVTNTGGCAVLVRKTAAVYRTIADGLVDGQDCAVRAGTLMIDGEDGPLTDIRMLAPNQMIGLKGNRDVVKISMEGESYSVTVAHPQQTLFAHDGSDRLNSLSIVGEDLWLAGVGLIIQGKNIWNGGAFAVSTISLNGGPLRRPMYQVQGTSNTNLWAIGSFYALHKTTP